MEEKQVLRKIDTIGELSTLPEVLAEVLRLADNEDSPLDNLAKVILKDVPLTARVLSAANSSLYGRQMKVSTVREAIMTLGARTVKSITLSISLVDKLKRLKTQIDLKKFWKHSLEVGIISNLIAQKLGLRFKEEAQIAGMLHDIGILIMDSGFPREYAHVWEGVQNGANLIELEETLFGTNHCRVGSYMASKWNLPDVYNKVIQDHHMTFELREYDKERTIPQIVNLAERISKYQLDSNPSLVNYDFDNSAIICKNLGLQRQDLNEIENGIVSHFLDASSFLEIDVGTPQELLNEANQRLFEIYREVEELLNQLKNETNYSEHIEYDRVAVEILHTVVATFSHYFNNACASMLGRAQLIEMALRRGELQDNKNVIQNSLVAIQAGVNNITGTIQELKQVKSFKTTLYHDKTLIIDLEDSLKKYKNKAENILTR